MSPNAKWTFMVYMAGDNNLSSAGEVDLGEMRRVGSTPEVNIVAEFDRIGNLHHTKRYFVGRGSLQEMADLGETDCGDPKVLSNFIAWAHANYPAERYALVLWNHGGGWEPSEMDRVARSAGARNYDVREATERASSPVRRSLFRTSLHTIFALPTATERAICSDDGSGHSLDTVELGKVLAEAARVLGQPIDLLGMDACLMSNLEVAYQAEPYVRYIVASEESEPNEGWPYEAVLSKLIAEPTLATADFATHIVQSYVQSYIDSDYDGDVTQSAFDLSRLPGLIAPLDRLADALIPRLPRAESQISRAHRKTKLFWHNTLGDIGDFGVQMKAATRDKPTRQAADDVRAALQPGAGRFVIAEAHRGAGVKRVSGATVYLPSPFTGISRYYADLEFARKHRWLKLLQEYHAA